MITFEYADSPEDGPRRNGRPRTSLCRQRIGALIRQVELERDRYEADGLVELLPPVSWHELVMQALAA